MQHLNCIYFCKPAAPLQQLIPCLLEICPNLQQNYHSCAHTSQLQVIRVGRTSNNPRSPPHTIQIFRFGSAHLGLVFPARERMVSMETPSSVHRESCRATDQLSTLFLGCCCCCLFPRISILDRPRSVS